MARVPSKSCNTRRLTLNLPFIYITQWLAENQKPLFSIVLAYQLLSFGILCWV